MADRVVGLKRHNFERGFHRLIDDEFTGLDPYYVELPLWSSKLQSVAYESVPVYLIFEWVEFIHAAGILQRHASLYGEDGTQGIEQVWHAAEACDVLKELAELAKKTAVPLLLHVDGVSQL